MHIDESMISELKGFYPWIQKSPCGGPRYNLNLRPLLGVVWLRML